MEKENVKKAIHPCWFSFLGSACGLLTLCHNGLSIKVWAVYCLPIVYVLFSALVVTVAVLLIKKRIFHYLWVPAMMAVLVFMLADEALGCVRDITGGTKTVKTAYYRIYTDNSIRWFEHDGDEDTTLKLDKKLAEKAAGHCTYDKTDTISVNDGMAEVFGCTETVEITYYPNSRTVTDIEFSPKQRE